MKKIVLLFTFASVCFFLKAQNLQLHYDMGEDRGYMTSTIEMYKPDKWGSNFFFVDMDFDREAGNSASFAYMEIARGLKFWESPWEIHIEYNGGTYINDSWLFGANYTWNNSDFSKIFTLQGMYKRIKDSEDVSFQITGVWSVQMLDKKFTFSGFADLWKERKYWISDKTNLVFLTEPQLWYNATEKLSLGTEIEIASNFTEKGFKVCPTIAAKWTF